MPPPLYIKFKIILVGDALKELCKYYEGFRSYDYFVGGLWKLNFEWEDQLQLQRFVCHKNILLKYGSKSLKRLFQQNLSFA